jgi:hypothetical protein
MTIDIEDPKCDIERCYERFMVSFWGVPSVSSEYCGWIARSDVERWARIDAAVDDPDCVMKLISAWVSCEYIEPSSQDNWWTIQRRQHEK